MSIRAKAGLLVLLWAVGFAAGCGRVAPEPTEPQAPVEAGFDFETLDLFSGLPDSRIVDMAAVDGGVWVSTRGCHIFRWDLAAGAAGGVSALCAAAERSATYMAPDGDYIWYAVRDSVWRQHPGTGEWVFHRGETEGAAGFVNRIQVEPDGVWLAADRGLTRFDRTTGAWSPPRDAPALAGLDVTDVKLWRGGVYAAAGEDGLWRSEPGAGAREWTLIRGVTPVRLAVHDQRLLFAGESEAGWIDAQGRAHRLRGLEGIEFWGRRPGGLVGVGDMTLMGTERGLTLWPGPDERPVQMFAAEGLADDRIESLLVVGDDLWIGTRRGITLVPLDKLDAWIGFARRRERAAPGNPILHRAVTSGWNQYQFNFHLGWRGIRSALIHDGRLWFATVNGLYGRDDGRWRDFAADYHIPCRGYGDLIAGRNRLWFACEEGAAVFEDRESAWVAFGRAQGFEPLEKLKFVTVGENHVWVGGLGGLNRYDKSEGRWRRYAESELGIGREIMLVREGPLGWAWILGVGGVAAEEMRTGTIRSWGPEDNRLFSRINDIHVLEDDVWLAASSMMRLDRAADEWSVAEGTGMMRNARSLAPDGDWLWFNSSDDVFRYNLTTGSSMYLRKVPAGIKRIEMDADMVWVQIETGILIYNKRLAAWTEFDAQSGLVGAFGEFDGLRLQGGAILIQSSDGVAVRRSANLDYGPHAAVYGCARDLDRGGRPLEAAARYDWLRRRADNERLGFRLGFMRARSLAAGGELEAALAEFESVRRAYPRTLLEMDSVYWRLGRYAEYMTLLRALEAESAHDPDFDEVLGQSSRSAVAAAVRLAEEYMDRGHDPGQVRALLENVLEMDPSARLERLARRRLQRLEDMFEDQ